MAFQENQIAIQNWQNWLNTNYGPGPWIPLIGFHTTTQLTYESNGGPVFNSNAGYPLKGFLNISTSEVKFFDARKFYAI